MVLEAGRVPLGGVAEQLDAVRVAHLADGVVLRPRLTPEGDDELAAGEELFHHDRAGEAGAGRASAGSSSQTERSSIPAEPSSSAGLTMHGKTPARGTATPAAASTARVRSFRRHRASLAATAGEGDVHPLQHGRDVGFETGPTERGLARVEDDVGLVFAQHAKDFGQFTHDPCHTASGSASVSPRTVSPRSNSSTARPASTCAGGRE